MFVFFIGQLLWPKFSWLSVSARQYQIDLPRKVWSITYSIIIYQKSISEKNRTANTKAMSPARTLKKPNRARKLYTVENIIDHQYQNGILKYRVKWLNFDFSHCTWEPIESFSDPNFVASYNQKNGIKCSSPMENRPKLDVLRIPVKKDVMIERIFAHRLIGGIFSYKVHGEMESSFRFTWKQANQFDDAHIIDEYNRQTGIGIYSSKKPLRIVAENRDCNGQVIFLIERQKTKHLEYVQSDWMIMHHPAIVNCYLDPWNRLTF